MDINFILYIELNLNSYLSISKEYFKDIFRSIDGH